MPSHQIAARPCMNVVWHSFQLKPITPGGAHSRMIFWYHVAASIAAGVSVSSFLPSARDGLLVPLQQDVVPERHVGVLQAAADEAIDALRRDR